MRRIRTYARSTSLMVALAVAGSCADGDLPLEPGGAAESNAKGSTSSKPVVLWREAVTGGDVILEAVWGSGRNDVYAVGRSGTIRHFDGRQWRTVPSGTTSGLYGIWGADRSNVFAVGGLGNVVRFDGERWSHMAQLRDDGGTARQLNAVWGSGSTDVWAVGNLGSAHHFDGAGWRFVKLPTSVDMRAVWGSGPADVFAVGDGGVIVHFDGTGWRAMESNTSTRLNAVWGRYPGSVFAAGSFGTIMHFDGSVWREHDQSRLATPQHLRDIWGNASHDVFAVGWGGAVLHFDGRRWTRMDSPTGVHLEGVWGSDGSQLVAVGYHGTALHGSRGRGGPGVAPIHPHEPEIRPIWPLSGRTDADADSVHSQYGPRYIPEGLDFHAGIDLPAPVGTPVLAVLPGVVTEITVWNGVSTGAGNAVTVVHSNNRATSYLHLNSVDVVVGQRLAQGEVLGTVGRSGATYPHLHLGYFVDMPASSRSESHSRNPLELLAHGNPEPIAAEFTGDGVRLSVPIRRMTVRSVEILGEGEAREVDYYEVVARGATLRKEPVQYGVRLTPGAGGGGRFPLGLEADGSAFRTERVVIVGIAGDTLLDVRREVGQ